MIKVKNQNTDKIKTYSYKLTLECYEDDEYRRKPIYIEQFTVLDDIEMANHIIYDSCLKIMEEYNRQLEGDE